MQVLQFNQFEFRKVKLLRKVGHLKFGFAVAIFKVIADEGAIFTSREDIIIVLCDGEFGHSAAMSLILKDFFAEIERVFAVSDRSQFFFLISAIEKHFFAVGKKDLGDIRAGKYFRRGRDIVFL